MKFNPDKPFVFVDTNNKHRPARLLCKDLQRHPYDPQLVVAVGGGSGWEHVYFFDLHGKNETLGVHLENIPEKRYVGIYECRGSLFPGYNVYDKKVFVMCSLNFDGVSGKLVQVLEFELPMEKE